MFRVSGTVRKGSKTAIYRHHFLMQDSLFQYFQISHCMHRAVRTSSFVTFMKWIEVKATHLWHVNCGGPPYVECRTDKHIKPRQCGGGVGSGQSTVQSTSEYPSLVQRLLSGALRCSQPARQWVGRPPPLQDSNLTFQPYTLRQRADTLCADGGRFSVSSVEQCGVQWTVGAITCKYWITTKFCENRFFRPYFWWYLYCYGLWLSWIRWKLLIHNFSNFFKHVNDLLLVTDEFWIKWFFQKNVIFCQKNYFFLRKMAFLPRAQQYTATLSRNFIALHSKKFQTQFFTHFWQLFVKRSLKNDFFDINPIT